MFANLLALMPFDFEGQRVRVLIDAQGKPWFAAADVCEVLDLGDASGACGRLDDGQSIRLPLGGQQMSVVNESGLYSLISTSPDTVGAMNFRHWVTHKVLPAVRKIGARPAPHASEPNALASLPTAIHERVALILMIGDAVTKVAGVKPDIAADVILDCIQKNAGLNVETLRRALPAANAPVYLLSATELGQLLDCSTKAANQMLAALGLQLRNDRDEWELTAAGQHWGRAIALSCGDQSGYRILWNPAVAGQMKEVA